MSAANRSVGRNGWLVRKRTTDVGVWFGARCCDYPLGGRSNPVARVCAALDCLTIHEHGRPSDQSGIVRHVDSSATGLSHRTVRQVVRAVSGPTASHLEGVPKRRLDCRTMISPQEGKKMERIYKLPGAQLWRRDSDRASAIPQFGLH